MPHKLLAALILILCVFLGTGEANQKTLVGFDLSMAGYRLGMSYEDVAKIRPFHYEQSVVQNPDGTPRFCALVEQADIDGVTMDLQISFKHDRVHKIVSRISSDRFEDVLQSLQQTLGAAEDRSRVTRNYNDKEKHQTLYLWDYPGATMYLIKISSDAKFSTMALLAK